MSDPKIISFNTIDFPSEAHLQVHLSNIEKRSEELFGKMEQYGLLRATVSQVFNMDGVNRVTWHLEYRDEAAMEKCRTLLDSNAQGKEQKVVANRGVVIFDWAAK